MAPAADPSVLLRWAAVGLDTVLLPSGLRVRLRVPEPAAMVVSGAMPKELRAIALQFAVGQRPQAGALTLEQIESFFQLQRHLAAASVRQVELEGTWHDVRLTGDQWEEFDLPPSDREAIEMICTSRATPDMISKASATALGLPTDDTQEEAASTVMGFAGFRGDAGGAGAGTDSPTVRAAPKRPAGLNRRQAGAGAG